MTFYKGPILKTLSILDQLYQNASRPASDYYCKLGVIEGCGWIEVAMDSMVTTYVKKNLRTSKFQRKTNEILKRNYGFRYDTNFLKMMCNIVGMREMERIEKRLNRNGDIDRLTAKLDTIKIHRDDASHTFIDVTKTYPSPGTIKLLIAEIFPILKNIEAEIRAL